MFAHVLAVLLGLGSVLFYVAAFFYPEVHRRSNIFLSGAGMLYAALLWFCAGQMTLMVLLTQVMAIALLTFLGWQTLSVRREKTPVYQQTPVALTPEVVGDWAKNTINQLRIAPTDKVRPMRPQNPSLNGTSADRFRPPLDPRRRPVYDYEFVEDGIAENAPEVAVVDDVTDLIANVPDVVPPSAEAEVIAAEVPEQEMPEQEVPEAERLEQGSFEPKRPEAQRPEAKGLEAAAGSEAESLEAEELESESPESESLEAEELESESLESKSLEVGGFEAGSSESISDEAEVFGADMYAEGSGAEVAEAVDEPSARTSSIASELASEPTSEPTNDPTSDADDWGFLEDDLDEGADLTGVAERRASPAGPAQQPSGIATQVPTEKPAIWAMPIILVGWVKDVVTSMAKPKPAKPVIEIPRRDLDQKSASDLNRPSDLNRGIDNESNRDLTGEPINNPVYRSNADEAAAYKAGRERADSTDNFIPDSNESNFDDFDDANWTESPENTVQTRLGDRAAQPIEESNWDD